MRAAAIALACGACGFPEVTYETAQEDGGAVDASKDGSDDASSARRDARRRASDDASDATMTTDAPADDGGALDAQADAEAGPVGPALASAASFAVLAATTVTNTGPSTVMGDLGLSPGPAVTGFSAGMGMVTGSTYVNDSTAAQAESDLLSAYDDLRSMDCPTDLTGSDLGSRTLPAGVYCYPSSDASLTGKLVLDAKGDPSALFVFQIEDAFLVTATATVEVVDGGSPCNVYWQVGSSATVGANVTLAGNILAMTSISLGSQVLMKGRALAEHGAVTMAMSVVGMKGCP